MQHIALAGISSGITAWYTQNKGFIVVLGLLGYLILKGGRVGTPVKRRWAKCCVLSLLALTIFFLGNFYFIQAAGFRRWWWCLVTFPVKYYGSVQLNNWHIYGEGLWPLRLGSVAPAFVYATVPLVYIICLLILHTSKQDGTEGRRSAVFLVSIVGFAIFLGISSAPSWKRISTVSPPAIVLLPWILDRHEPSAKRLKIGLMVSAVVLAVTAAVRSQARWSAFLDLPVGKTAFTDRGRYDEYRYAMTRMCCGQLVFGTAPLVFALDVKNPTPIDVFVPFDYTRPEQLAQTILVLERQRVRLLMLNRGMFDWPGVSPATDHLAPMRAYLGCRYRLTATFQTDDQLWERVDHAGDCSAVAQETLPESTENKRLK